MGVMNNVVKINLWDNTPGKCEEIPRISVFIPENRQSDAAVVVFPGGGYVMRSDYEGEGYAKFLQKNGYCAFVVDYRLSPHEFPLPLLDARRAVRYVRYYADKYGINKNKIAVMGSSAGGHLAALLSTYFENIDFEDIDEIDKEEFVPNAQILCYPVIKMLGKDFALLGCGKKLLGSHQAEMGEDTSPDLIANHKTPQAFIWHTFNDNCVNVINSIDYARKLKLCDVPTELHIFPQGEHGLGLAEGTDSSSVHVSQWNKLLLNWLNFINFKKGE